MIEAVIYRRVSTKRQSDEGRSLRDQDGGLVDFCHAKGWRIIGNFEDAISGRTEKTEKRVGFAAAVAQAKARKATFVCFDVDRLARSQTVGCRVIEELRDAGARLAIKSLDIDTNTPMGELILGIMLAVAQWGSRAIGAGVKRANDATKEELGHRTQGAKPYGWKFDAETKQLVHDPLTYPLVGRILAVIAENGRKPPEMCAYLNAQGILTPKGLEWSVNRLAEFRRTHGTMQALPPVTE